MLQELLAQTWLQQRKVQKNYEKLITYTEGYKDLGIYALVAGLVLILISPFVKKLMQEVH